MKTYSIRITGSGTVNQLACRLLDIGRELQKVGVYGGEVEREEENETLMIEITEE